MSRKISFSPEARSDLFGLYDYIAAASGPNRALAYLERIEAYCLGFGDFPERGARHDHIRPGLRTIGFERRVLIAFHITKNAVIVDRILYGGRDLGSAFGDDG